ncbi:MAG: hypothetical protein ACPLSX_02445 [Arcobacter sp.]
MQYFILGFILAHFIMTQYNTNTNELEKLLFTADLIKAFLIVTAAFSFIMIIATMAGLLSEKEPHRESPVFYVSGVLHRKKKNKDSFGSWLEYKKIDKVTSFKSKKE